MALNGWWRQQGDGGWIEAMGARRLEEVEVLQLLAGPGLTAFGSRLSRSSAENCFGDSTKGQLLYSFAPHPQLFNHLLFLLASQHLAVRFLF
jgi:hypothetical protein